MIHCEKYKATHSASTCIARLKKLRFHDQEIQRKGAPKSWQLTGKTITDSQFEGCRGCLESLPEMIKREEARLKKKNKKRDSAPSAIDSPVFKGKKCRRCGNLKSVEDFGKCTSNKDGLHSYCKKCLSEYDKERARKKRTSAKTGIKHKEKTSPEKLKVVQGQQQSPFVIVVDLSEYPDVYEGIKEIAREEERTIEGQVRYWLKNEEFLQANFDLDQHPSGKVVSVPE